MKSIRDPIGIRPIRFFGLWILPALSIYAPIGAASDEEKEVETLFEAIKNQEEEFNCEDDRKKFLKENFNGKTKLTPTQLSYIKKNLIFGILGEKTDSPNHKLPIFLSTKLIDPAELISKADNEESLLKIVLVRSVKMSVASSNKDEVKTFYPFRFSLRRAGLSQEKLTKEALINFIEALPGGKLWGVSYDLMEPNVDSQTTDENKIWKRSLKELEHSMSIEGLVSFPELIYQLKKTFNEKKLAYSSFDFHIKEIISLHETHLFFSFLRRKANDPNTWEDMKKKDKAKTVTYQKIKEHLPTLYKPKDGTEFCLPNFPVSSDANEYEYFAFPLLLKHWEVKRIVQAFFCTSLEQMSKEQKIDYLKQYVFEYLIYQFPTDLLYDKRCNQTQPIDILNWYDPSLVPKNLINGALTHLQSKECLGHFKKKKYVTDDSLTPIQWIASSIHPTVKAERFGEAVRQFKESGESLQTLIDKIPNFFSEVTWMIVPEHNERQKKKIEYLEKLFQQDQDLLDTYFLLPYSYEEFKVFKLVRKKRWFNLFKEKYEKVLQKFPKTKEKVKEALDRKISLFLKELDKQKNPKDLKRDWLVKTYGDYLVYRWKFLYCCNKENAKKEHIRLFFVDRILNNSDLSNRLFDWEGEKKKATSLIHPILTLTDNDSRIQNLSTNAIPKRKKSKQKPTINVNDNRSSSEDGGSSGSTLKKREIFSITPEKVVIGVVALGVVVGGTFFLWNQENQTRKTPKKKLGELASETKQEKKMRKHHRSKRKGLSKAGNSVGKR